MKHQEDNWWEFTVNDDGPLDKLVEALATVLDYIREKWHNPGEQVTVNVAIWHGMLHIDATAFEHEEGCALIDVDHIDRATAHKLVRALQRRCDGSCRIAWKPYYPH